MKIGELAEWAKCPAVTIRYYEKIGLLSGEKRDRLNHRIYDNEDKARLRLILHCRNHGISMKDIRTLLDLRTSAGEEGMEAVNIVRDQLEKLKSRRESLDQLIESLSNLLNATETDDSGGKGIIDALASPCPYCPDYGESSDRHVTSHAHTSCLANPEIRRGHGIG